MRSTHIQCGKNVTASTALPYSRRGGGRRAGDDQEQVILEPSPVRWREWVIASSLRWEIRTVRASRVDVGFAPPSEASSTNPSFSAKSSRSAPGIGFSFVERDPRSWGKDVETISEEWLCGLRPYGRRMWRLLHRSRRTDVD